MKKIKKFFDLIYFSGLIFLPSFYFTKSPVPYEVPKVFLFNIWVGILFILTSIALLKGEKYKLNKIIFFVILLFLFYAFLSSFLGENLQKSFWGNYYRADGLLTLINLVLLSFITALNANTQWLKNIIKYSTIGILIVIAETLIKGLKYYLIKDQFIGNYFWPVSANFGNPNFLGGFLCITIPFTFYLFKQKKVFRFIIIFLQVIAVILTQSWSSIIIAFFSLSGLVLILAKNIKRAIILSLPIVIIVLGIATLYVTKYLSIKQSYIGGYMPEGRGRIFTKALLAIKEKPVSGWGWANFDYAFDKIDWPMKYQHDLYVDKAHSAILETAVATGIPGLLLHLSITAIAIKKLIFFTKQNEMAKYILLVFILFLIHSQTNIISVSEEIYFWMIVGISATKKL